MKIYIASALFSPHERTFNVQLAAALESLCEIYLPQRDGVLIEQKLREGPQAVREACQQVYLEDLDAIRQSDVLVAVLDGRALDEGVCIELGFAKALGKSIVGYKSDVRITLPWGQNPLVSGCIDAWVASIDELHSWVEKQIGQSKGPQQDP